MPGSEQKKLKLETDVENSQAVCTTGNVTCSHFVTRKKRLCRITVAKGEIYCGEHLPLKELKDGDSDEREECHRKRIPCPLDPKHTVYEKNLHKHLKICNAKVTNLPEYILPGLNAGPDDCPEEKKDFRLSQVDAEILKRVIEKVNSIYDKFKVEDTIEEQIQTHDLLKEEISNAERGQETLKHLIQTSSLLSQMEHSAFLKNDTAFIEFGAGKGQVAYWLAQAAENLEGSHVLLIDKASLRHKKDNKMKDTHSIQRIRADISDFDIRKYDLLQNSKRIVGVSKHLCGAATDFTIRCILNGNDNGRTDGKTEGFIIALCCHHRCSWKPFVGKHFFIEHNVTVDEFIIITKMVGWAVCGTGMSRERRKELEENSKGRIEIIINRMNNIMIVLHFFRSI